MAPLARTEDRRYVRMMTEKPLVRVVTETEDGGIAWFSLIVEGLLGSWPSNPEKSKVFAVVYDDCDVERARISVRSLIAARRLRLAIVERASTMLATEVNQWHESSRWGELYERRQRG